MHQCLRCSVKLVLVPLLLAGVADGVTPVMGAAASAQAAGAAVPVTTRARLDGVAATSATNAWAVGGTSTGTTTSTLAERWNGTAWKQVPTPAPAGSHLTSVAATSATNAWAVGSYVSGISIKTLILRWNGTAWKQVPSPSPQPSPGLADFLFGVAITPTGNAWAVGDISCGCGPGISLILHWNGSAWKRVPSPTPGGGTILFGVAAVSDSRAWAVGETGSGDGPTNILILRWNGTAWK